MPDATRIAVPHLRLIFGGTLGAAATEIWACGIKLVGQAPASAAGVFAPTQAPSGALLPGLLADATADINGIVDTGGSGGPNLTTALTTNMLPAIKVLWSAVGRADASLTFAKLNAFGGDDHQLNTTTVESQFAPTPGPNATDVTFATAAVAEFRSSNRHKGFASHGRMMVPAAVQMGAEGKISNLHSQNPGGGGELIGAANSHLLTFLAALNIDSTPGGAQGGSNRQFIPSIVYTSLPDHIYKSAGARPPTFNPIDRCFWSDIPGEVRRRQNKLKQGVSASTVAYGSTSA